VDASALGPGIDRVRQRTGRDDEVRERTAVRTGVCSDRDVEGDPKGTEDPSRGRRPNRRWPGSTTGDGTPEVAHGTE
jgi:hypothetical protein